MTRDRTGNIYRARGGRIHPHTSKTSGIEPERDSLGRRAPRKLTRAAQEARAVEKQAKQEQLSQAPYWWLR